MSNSQKSIFGSGVLLLICFASLSVSRTGLGVSYWGPTGYESQQELSFWIGTLLLLWPGLTLTLWPFHREISERLSRVGNWVTRLTPKEKWTLLILSVVIGTAIARIGHFIVFADFPFTDDECGAEFGGQIYASGHLMTAVTEPFMAYAHPFMYVSHGQATSFELPGVNALWALGEWLGDPAMIWAFVSALSIVPMVMVCRRLFDVRWTIFTLAVYALSPQFIALSMSTHSHIATRTLTAFCLWAFVEMTTTEKKMKFAFLFGLFTGLAFLTRMYEISVILLPFYVCLFIQAVRTAKTHASLFAASLIGFAIPLAALIWVDIETTGSALQFARNHPYYYDVDLPGYESLRHLISTGTPFSLATLWARVGGNLTNNLLGLWMWFYAPLGGIFVVLGATRTRFTLLMTGSVLACLALALFHDNFGIHSVGPINYSELAPILALLASYGVQRCFEFVSATFARAEGRLTTVLAASLISSMVFLAINCHALRQQGLVQQTIYDFVDEALDHSLGDKSDAKVIVLAPRFVNFVFANPTGKKFGSYVNDWRIPHPSFSERITFLRDEASLLGDIRKTFPDRKIFKLVVLTEKPYLAMSEIGSTPTEPSK